MNKLKEMQCGGGRFGSLAPRLRLAALFFIATSTVAGAAGDGSPSDDSPLPLSPRTRPAERPSLPAQPQLARTAAALIGVLGGVVLAVIVVRKFVPGLASNSTRRMIDVLGQSPLGNRATVYVVRCGPRVLILGVTPSHVATLAEIADDDEIEQFARLGRPHTEQQSEAAKRNDAHSSCGIESLKGQVEGLLDKVGSWKAGSHA